MNKTAPIPCVHHRNWNAHDRIVIEGVYPELYGGRYPVKGVVGDCFEVWATLPEDGIRSAPSEGAIWRVTPFRHVEFCAPNV